MNKRVKIYADGACSSNHLKDNKGGYGAVIYIPGEEPYRISRGYKNTTNNRMELKAVIEALKRVKESSSVIVYSDSEYVVKGITEWIHNWIKKGKINTNGDLWVELYKLVKRFENIEFEHVRGHAGNKGNIEADKLATTAYKGFNLIEDVEHSYSLEGI